MSKLVVGFVPSMVRGRKRDGRNMCERTAKREFVRRSLQSDVTAAMMALAHGLNVILLRNCTTMATKRPIIAAP